MSSKSDNVAKLRANALRALTKKRLTVSLSMDEALEMTSTRTVKAALRELASPRIIPAFMSNWFRNFRAWGS